MDISAQPEGKSGTLGSVRAIGVFGSVLALALAVGLVLVIVNDYRSRMAAAERQSLALVTGAERLVDFELRNIESALAGFAAYADRTNAFPSEDVEALRLAHVGGVMAGHREIESISLLSADGTPVFGTRSGASGIADWGSRRNPNQPQALRMGPLRKLINGQWAVPLAMPLKNGGYVLARLNVSELQSIVGNLDSGQEGVVTLFDTDGTVLARSRDALKLIGTRRPQVVTDSNRAGEEVSAIDGVTRVGAWRVLLNYPLVLHAGLSKQEILRPWYWLIAAGTGVYLLYLTGFIYLLRLVMKSNFLQRALIGRLRERTEDLRLAQKVGGTGSWSIVAGEEYVRWSDNVSNIFGLPESQTSASRTEFYDMVHPEDRERLFTLFQEAWEKQHSFNAEYRIRHPDGATRWLATQGAVVPGRDKRMRMTGTVVDVTERVEAQARIADAERQFRLMFEQNPLPFWVFDIKTLRFLEVNRAALEQYGYTREEFLAMTILQIRPPETIERVLQDIGAPREHFGQASNWIHQRKDGSRFEVKVYAANIDFAGTEARLILAEDVSERAAYERQLAYRASHDATTGLLTLDEFSQHLSDSASADEIYRVAYLELRGLDLIADTLGREASEGVLRIIAARLRLLCGDHGMAAHVPSNAFALALPAADHTAHRRLHSLTSEPVESADASHHLESWIGFADYPGDGASASEVVRNAALAAHEARATNMPFAHYQVSIAEKAHAQLTLAGRIRHAIRDNQFELHFQIIRHAADSEPAALEALIRWPQLTGGFIPPSQFIPLCEDSGLIVPLGQWVLRRAAESHRQLSAAGWGSLPIAVNVSTNQFVASDLVSDIAAIVDEFGLRKGALHIELTESVVMNRPEQALNTMHRLQKQGVCISIDDFGTGFSNMSYLRHLPLDALKIDRSFVTDVDNDVRNASICRALLSLGHSLGLEVIAEGVERIGQYEWLKEHGCDQVQGYLFGMPMPLDKVIETLNGADQRSWLGQDTATGQRSGY
ncbi:EAL domain-containing protein [Pseudoxanthomonas sp. UTMC 1351]|uniref:bifunctional diguanylate cyclase/phosphodiesterase n=1 Tax=Pseudoxanthomonas sp. UTMC 1351 TaxID=2695853 RepID=UPI0034CDD863